MTTNQRRNRSLPHIAACALGAAFALFLSIFALDVFEEHSGIVKVAVALGIHLVPTFALLLATIAAWFRPLLGALLFAGLGVAYVASAWGRFPLGVYFVVAGPAFGIAALLVAASWRERHVHGGAS